MSWESNETKKPCPCGAGTYTVIDRSDDWGRFETNWRMDCPICNNQYSLYTFDYSNSGLREQGHRWVKTELYEKAIDLKSRAEEAKENAVSLAKDRYLSVLEEMFAKSSKKAIWQVLNANIKWYKSLGTFYKHTKNQEKREYLEELFSHTDLTAILKIAKVNDKEIGRLLNDSSVFESEADTFLRG